MDPTHDESPPGCLAILLPLSASLNADVRVWLGHRLTGDGEPEVRDIPGFIAARFLADELLEGLVYSLAAGYHIPLDVVVLGYGTAPDGTLRLVSLLPTKHPTPRFLPLAEIAALPVEPRNREGDPRKWTTVAACEGAAPAAAALAEVYRLTAMWLTGRYAARPPVVLHVTDGNGLDEHYHRVAKSLGLLATGYGSPRLLHVGLVPGIEPSLCGLRSEPLPEPWAGLCGISALLAPEADGRPERRAVSINDWSPADCWSALFDIAWSEDTIDWMGGDRDRLEQATARGLWTQKMGNTPEQWEDAFAHDPPAGTAAIADGASTGIYCRKWADELTKSLISERPDLRTPSLLGKWVQSLRAEWRAAIDYDKLNWSKKAKVDDVGAAATLLGLEIGPADAEGNRRWRASSIGDACLFWVRDGSLLGTFPVVAADQFGSAPLLARSNPGHRTLALHAEGTCEPGDRFLLATDAVAAYLLKSVAADTPPDWGRFETIDEAEWRAELDMLRRSNEMVNDDCTVVTLRVRGENAVERDS
jgi:hypothetical protein